MFRNRDVICDCSLVAPRLAILSTACILVDLELGRTLHIQLLGLGVLGRGPGPSAS